MLAAEKDGEELKMITVPKSHELMLPILIFAREKQTTFNVRWTYKFLINDLDLSKDIFDVKLKNGSSKFDSNVRWAINDLYNAKLLKRVDRGYYKITDRGLDVLEENHKKIDRKYLMRFREFREYMAREYKKDYVLHGQTKLF